VVETRRVMKPNQGQTTFFLAVRARAKPAGSLEKRGLSLILGAE